MTPKDFWEQYVGAQAPVDFMVAFRSLDPAGCVGAYLAERPSFFGIVRRLSWRETFAAEVQHTRQVVLGNLTTYIEEHRDLWEPLVQQARAHDAGAPATPPAPEAPEASTSSDTA